MKKFNKFLLWIGLISGVFAVLDNGGQLYADHAKKKKKEEEDSECKLKEV